MMNFKHFGNIILIMLFMMGCQQNSEDKQMEENEADSVKEQGMDSSLPVQQTQEAEISDKELQQFASIVQQVQVINQEAQQEMVSLVEAEGLNVQRYTEIQQSQQDPQKEVNATAEELKQYETATEEISKIHAQAQQEMRDKINEEGMTVNRYQEIGTALQNDPELQERIREYLQEG